MEFTKWLRLQWDRVGAWLFVIAGGVVLILGWVGVSGTAYPADQLPYILSGGVAGIFLLGVGAMLWLSADLRDEWRKLDNIERNLRQTGRLPQPPVPPLSLQSPTFAAYEPYMVQPGGVPMYVPAGWVPAGAASQFSPVSAPEESGTTDDADFAPSAAEVSSSRRTSARSSSASRQSGNGTNRRRSTAAKEQSGTNGAQLDE